MLDDYVGTWQREEVLLQPSKPLLQPSPSQWSTMVLRGPWDEAESIFLCRINFFKTVSLNTISNPLQLSMPIVVHYWPLAPSHSPSKTRSVLPGNIHSPSGHSLASIFSLSLFFPPCPTLCPFFLLPLISKISVFIWQNRDELDCPTHCMKLHLKWISSKLRETGSFLVFPLSWFKRLDIWQ